MARASGQFDAQQALGSVTSSVRPSAEIAVSR
jgi:hypothetical protein